MDRWARNPQPVAAARGVEVRNEPDPTPWNGVDVGSGQSGRRRSLGVAGRAGFGIFAVAFIVSLATGQWAASRVRDMRRAQQLEVNVDALSAIETFRVALFNEEVQWVLLRNQAEVAGGSDRLVISNELQAAIDVTDSAGREIPSDQRPVDPSDLERLRNTCEFGKIAPGQIGVRFADLQSAVDQRVTNTRRNAEQHAYELGAPEIARKLDFIDDLDELFIVSAEMTRGVMSAWYGDPIELSLARSQLAASSERFKALAVGLLDSAERPNVVKWRTVVTSAPGFDLEAERLATGALDSFVVPGANRPDLSALREGSDRAVAIGAWIPEAARGIVRMVRAERDAHETQAIVGVVGSLLIFAAVCLVAMLFARTLIRPLRALAAASKRVVSGDLAIEPLSLKGPTEVAEASEAFNLTLEAMRLIEAKARALAVADLDADVLRQPLRGRVGESLSRSVDVLSESLSAREKLEDRLGYQATHDNLTGIENRASAIDRVQAALGRSPTIGGTVAVVLIDLDNFGAINDAFGHAAGDVVLQHVAKAMSIALVGRATVARVGGDEFVVIAEEVEGPAEALGLAERAMRALKTPIELPHNQVIVEASIGVAVQEPMDTTADLLRRADISMYRAKRNEPGTIRIFDDQLKAEISERLGIEDGLRAALAADDQLRLEFQPVVNAWTGKTVSAEALIRWERPGHGFVPPDKFIQIAEQTGLILDIDRWVLSTALLELATWPADPLTRTLSLAINISGRHLVNAHFLDNLITALESTGADPTRLILEITETVLVMDLELMTERLGAIRELGIRIAIDDYGTGFTSLAHVRSLPIDELKIDKSFVQGLQEGMDNHELIKMICGLARLLDVDTVGEGVERESDVVTLRTLGCTNVQGYHFSRSLTPDAFREWLREHAAEVSPY